MASTTLPSAEPAVMEGTLRSTQGSAVGVPSERYHVLRGQRLFLYADAEDARSGDGERLVESATVVGYDEWRHRLESCL